MKRLMLIIEIIVILVIGGLVTYEYIKLKDNNNDRFDVRDNNFILPDIVGEISAISQSNITLKVIDMRKPGDKSEVQNENTNVTTESIPTFRHFEYTGETKDFVIPDVVKIISHFSEQIDVKDLKVGDIIGISFKEDKITIDSIRLINLKSLPKNINTAK